MITHINLRQLRELMGVSQNEMAKYLNISQSFYSKIENFKYETKESYYLSIAQKFNIDVDELRENRISVFFMIKNNFNSVNKTQEVSHLISRINQLQRTLFKKTKKEEE